MYEDNIIKVWGTRKRLLLTDTIEVDLLNLKKGCFCSIHIHDTKYNYFYSISATVQINTDIGSAVLHSGEYLTVNPHMTHQFKVLKGGKLLEVAYVKKGKINVEDIKRKQQGGKIINGEELSIPELKKMGLLNL